MLFYAGRFINRTKRLALVDGIKYQKIGNESYYAQELFQQEELMGYLKKNMLKDATKSVFEHVVYDSGGYLIRHRYLALLRRCFVVLIVEDSW